MHFCETEFVVEDRVGEIGFEILRGFCCNSALAFVSFVVELVCSLSSSSQLLWLALLNLSCERGAEMRIGFGSWFDLFDVYNSRAR